jgi:hypothetical protein
VAERLRRSTRNRLGLSRVGSSPAGVAFLDHVYDDENNTLLIWLVVVGVCCKLFFTVLDVAENVWHHQSV